MDKRETTRADMAHELAKSAYGSALMELSKAEDLGMMLAATAKCGAWLMGEFSAATVLQDDGMTTRWKGGMPTKGRMASDDETTR